jgi:exonuclease SbcD
LGKRLEHFSRFEEQVEVMEEICILADENKVDLVLVAGDVFDVINPPAEATELLYRTLKKLSNNGERVVLVISGNHDSPDRITAPDALAKSLGIFFIGYPDEEITPVTLDSGIKITQSDKGLVELQYPAYDYPVRILFTPYANEIRLRTYLEADDKEIALRNLLQEKWTTLANRYCDKTGVNVLVTHLFLVKGEDNMPEEPDDEKPILHVGGAQAVYTSNIPKQIQYTALGHLHRMHFQQKEPNVVAYAGSPLSYSFSEAEQQKYCLLVDAVPGEDVEVETLALQKGRKLLRKKFESIPEAIAWLEGHQEALVELTIVADEYLTAQERKALYQSHDGIINLIPEIKNKAVQAAGHQSVNLNQSMQDLFSEYFESRLGQKPNEELLEVFKEVINAEEGGEK